MGKFDDIPQWPLLGLYNSQLIFNMSKILVYIYTTDKQINQFGIGYPTLHIYKLFRGQVENY